MKDPYANKEFSDIKRPETFRAYADKRRLVIRKITELSPYSILLSGKTSPMKQILVKQPDGKYIIKYESNKFSGGSNYTVKKGHFHRNFQPVAKIINKIMDANFDGYIINDEEELANVVNGAVDETRLATI